MIFVEKNEGQEEISKINKLTKLRNIISEFVRAEKSNISDITYIESKNNLSTASSKSNHIIFGRRGTGKTMLLGNLHKLSPQMDFYSILFDCELLKKYSYPDIIISIMCEILEDLLKNLGFAPPMSKKRKLKKEMENEIKILKEMIKGEDYQESNKKEEEELSNMVGGSLGIGAGQIEAKMGNSKMRKIKQTKE